MALTSIVRLLAVALVSLGTLLPAGASAQMRGGPPMGLPPMNVPGGGFPGSMGGGPPGGWPLPRAADLPIHGRPPWAVAEDLTDAVGRNAQAVTVRLSKAQRDRAADRARLAPDLYELDRNGALSIRSEVLATGLDAAALARLEQRGFAILRREQVPGVDIELSVVSHAGMDVEQAMRLLRRIAPAGTYAPNHVLFESGAPRHLPTLAAAGNDAPPLRDTPVKVGLVDTGVGVAIDADPRVRTVRQNFARGESRPGPHGTAVAALLTRERGRIALYCADIFGSDPRGGTSELLVRALGWMAQSRVPVVNVSMVGPGNPIVAAAIARLIAQGFVIVAPVGNDGGAARPLFPASYPGVIAVSGAGANGRLLPEASRVKRVDFVAPGIATVPDPAGRPVEVRGTSFAAPIVSRLIADRMVGPDPVAAQRAVRALAAQAQRPRGVGGGYGYGLIGM